jgi:hypothetical protein
MSESRSFTRVHISSYLANRDSLTLFMHLFVGVCVSVCVHAHTHVHGCLSPFLWGRPTSLTNEEKRARIKL